MPDIVVIGAGHNALVCAAYLARAGLGVEVLESSSHLGGGTVTDQLTLPGFRHDTASTGHIGLQYNPVVSHDELELLANGLRYVTPDPVAVVHLPGGETVALHRDAKTTADALGADGPAWHAILADWAAIKELHLGRMARPPGTGADENAAAAELWAELAAPSATDLIDARFDGLAARTLLTWLAAITTQPIHRPGTGLLAVSLAGMMSEVGWPGPAGGSGALAEALAADLLRHGARVRTGAHVDHILVEDGRAVGVRCRDGSVVRAARGVVSASNATTLPGLLAPHPLPPEFDRLEQWRPGASMFVVHLALDRPPRYATPDGPAVAVTAGFGTVEGIRRQAADVQAGRLSDAELWVLAACSSVADPQRAPEGKATLKILTAAPFALGGDPANWACHREAYADQLVGVLAAQAHDFDPATILARVVHDPTDIAASNPHNVCGSHQGGEMTADQMGVNRPVPGWSGYRMPVAGLYQTGASTHPGGGVSGFPGRNAARVVLADLCLDPALVMDHSTHRTPA